MKNENEFKTAKSTKELVELAKSEGYNYYVVFGNTSNDYFAFFKEESEAKDYANSIDPDGELQTIWDLNDDMSNEVLFED